MVLKPLKFFVCQETAVNDCINAFQNAFWNITHVVSPQLKFPILNCQLSRFHSASFQSAAAQPNCGPYLVTPTPIVKILTLPVRRPTKNLDAVQFPPLSGIVRGCRASPAMLRLFLLTQQRHGAWSFPSPCLEAAPRPHVAQKAGRTCAPAVTPEPSRCGI